MRNALLALGRSLSLSGATSSAMNVSERKFLLTARKRFRRILRLCPAFVLIFFPPSQQPQAQKEITVRFVDYRSGKPITKLEVMVKGFNGKLTGRSADSTTIFNTSTRTDDQGKLIVPLPQVSPERISVSSFDLAESVASISLSDVLKSGAVAPYRNGERHPSLSVAAKPGEIVILNRKLTVWEKMRREIP